MLGSEKMKYTQSPCATITGPSPLTLLQGLLATHEHKQVEHTRWLLGIRELRLYPVSPGELRQVSSMLKARLQKD